ncbi:unnamed protein product [Prorocentrum cordatum]|uniref:Uncharacterized protein n=1 Tax=Prorocentrum cordatum TaxID=2364126 RepID=A0ABN9T6P4_9DINO|nr:unnamed protein product [Polarella glacialis]
MAAMLGQRYRVQVRNTFIDDFGPGAEEPPTRAVRRSRSEPPLRTLAARAAAPAAEPEAPEGALGLGPVGALGRMEAERTARGVLEVAFQQLASLSPEEVAAALHLAARRLRAPQLEAASGVLLPPLLSWLRGGIAELRGGSRLSQLAWALGKFGTRAHPGSPPPVDGIDECMFQVCRRYPAFLAGCSDAELTNSLWGLARICPGAAGGAAGGAEAVVAACHAMVRGCLGRVEALTAQCLANAFWAMARLKVRGPDAAEFVTRALARLRTAPQLAAFTPQGLANVLWALAQLRLAGVCAGPLDSATVQAALVAVAEASSHRLGDFQPQELSMAAWSFAKLYRQGRSGGPSGIPAWGGRCSARPTEVDSMLMRLASVATRRIDQFADQGISNIAWALATLGLAGGEAAAAPGRLFVESAMDFCSTELRGYSTQAVANILWACVRVDPEHAVGLRARRRLDRFCSAAAEVVTERMASANGRGQRANLAVTWKDLSGVAAALSYGRQKSQPVARFGLLLARQAAEQVSEGGLTRQEMLNISLSVARMRVPPTAMQELVDSVATCFAVRGDPPNQLDLFQWGQVQKWCPPSPAQFCGAGVQASFRGGLAR